MSILVKPYTIAVYDDVWDPSSQAFKEQRLGVIGSNEMISQSRALEPNLIRNVNGQNRFSFKMYKKYIDIVTGKEITNPFCDWLVSERKIKLDYEDKWYDFIIKDINENSSTYLYTYQLEDANIQELSKNGFGMTLDAELQNNIGDSVQLAQFVMAETDWEVSGDVAIETVDEALVYVTVPAGVYTHIIDQQPDVSGSYTVGVTTEQVKFEEAMKVLAFYSCCKEKPHRFQFICCDEIVRGEKDGNGEEKPPHIKQDNNIFDKNIDGTFQIARKDDRTILAKDCQYYVDFNDPESQYSAGSDGSPQKKYDLFLPRIEDGKNITLTSPANRYNEFDSLLESDTYVSTWYRGKRYGFAPQSVYVPLLDKYCSRYTKQVGSHELVKSFWFEGSSAPQNTSWSNDILQTDGTVGIKIGQKETTGQRIPYSLGDVYTISFEVLVANTSNLSFETYSPYFYQTYDITELEQDDPLSRKYQVTACFSRKAGQEDSDEQDIIIKPKISGILTFSGIQMSIGGEYFGYIDTKYVSPVLIQNYINNYGFDSTAGWEITAETRPALVNDPEISNVCGRFDGNGLRSMIDDFLAGTYSESIVYAPYMVAKFTENNQFVLNSGLRDNRGVIGNLSVGSELVVDYEILSNMGVATDNLIPSIAEFVYDVNAGGYRRRDGFITFVEVESERSSNRCVFRVATNNYTDETFASDSKLYVCFSYDDDIEFSGPKTYYIKKASVYKKVLNKSGNIIEPDYDAEDSEAIDTFIDEGILQKEYKYFAKWLLDNTDISSADCIPYYSTNVLTYDTYKPIYNEDARKIRTVTAKESNYFNILQSIAETFEQWVAFDVTRKDDGSIDTKKIIYKNYSGNDNYACFRYGVNLKDTQRTYSSKNITTKLIVKQNNNEYAENGFCSIQRASGNPTGENYIYDFQYFHNTGMMNVEEYLNNNYYMDGAQGEDGEAWENNEVEIGPTNIKGYFPRLKKLNESLIPINNEIAGHKTDLVQYQSKEKIEKATLDAATDGIETVREDFKALTGIYPESAQDGQIEEISVVSATSQDSWCTVPLQGSDGAPTVNNNVVTFTVNMLPSTKSLSPTVLVSGGTREQTVSNYLYKIYTNEPWDGIQVKYNYEQNHVYLLEYDIEVYSHKVNSTETSNLGNIGSRNDSEWIAESTDGKARPFIQVLKTNTGHIDSISHTNSEGQFNTVCKLTLGEGDTKNGTPGCTYHVTMVGKCNNSETASFWIQPNRGISNPVKYVVSNIKLYEHNGEAPEVGHQRTAYINLITNVMLKDGKIVNRKYTVQASVPAGHASVIATQTIAAIDTSRADIQKYFKEYTTYFTQRESSFKKQQEYAEKIRQKEQAIKELEAKRDRYLEYKKVLNQLFFKKYSRFIQEGTWMSEEHVDDEKYYADSQSVLYNSCYPQVAYAINVLELSQLPGYELFKFGIGDKTWVIDDSFFGAGVKEEVVITELSEMLDDPSRNTIKVQNFKNQFQNLFQKITATVQQAQYNASSYEKGSRLIEANTEKQSEFITSAINDAAAFLAPGNTHTVTWEGGMGITVTDDKTPTNQVRIVGGAILLSAENPLTKEQTWITGVTNKGISANLITAGKLNTGEIQIMSGDDPVFRWDAYGISAYHSVWYDGDVPTISSVDTKKFVRFDKYGIYGINNVDGIDGATWHPGSSADVDNNATFALTWEGLKVTNNKEIELRIGNNARVSGSGDESLLTVKQKDSEDYIFAIKENGTVSWGEGSSPTKVLYAKTALTPPPDNSDYDNDFDWSNTDGSNVWHKTKAEDDYYATYSYNGGRSWGNAILIAGRDGANAIRCEIESSLGALIPDTYADTDTVIFTARIYSGEEEIDPEGDTLDYIWYCATAGEDEILEDIDNDDTSKTLEVFIKDIKGKQVYFTAEEKSAQTAT